MAKDILVIGSGGREHALAWKLAQSPHVGKIYVAPGNGGTRKVGENVPIEPADIASLARFAKERAVDLTVVGPEGPLAAGIVSLFRVCGLRIFGPTRPAAEIETSKAFAKHFMLRRRIPTAPFGVFDEYDEAVRYVRDRGAPIVVKASGLAQGKGAYPCVTIPEAEEALKEIMVRRVYGAAGETVVIEEFLRGDELSIHAFCDGKTAVMFPPAQDHKPVFDGDRGPNTGGMGAYAPVPSVTREVLREIQEKIVQSALDGLATQGTPFVGCLYPGLKMTADGPYVLEFNARFGDPETQAYMRLLKTDLFEILAACVEGRLDQMTIEWHDGFAICVVIASHGYPGPYEKGFTISGIEGAESLAEAVVFHAGTFYENSQLRTTGGRVLGVTMTAPTLQAARDAAYEAVNRISFQGMQYRKDIGAKAIAMYPPA